MAYVKIQDSTLKDIADETRAKLNTEAQFKPSELPNAIKAIDVSENIYVGSAADDLYIGESTEPTMLQNNDITRIRKYGFYGCNNITALDLRTLKEVDFGGFYYCENLQSIYVPNLEVIGANAFARTGLRGKIYLPSAYSLGNTCFYTAEKDAITDVYFGRGEGGVQFGSSVFNGNPTIHYGYRW